MSMKSWSWASSDVSARLRPMSCFASCSVSRSVSTAGVRTAMVRSAILEFLEQRAQLERGPLGAIARQRRRGVALAVDAPGFDGRRRGPGRALRSLRPALARRPGPPLPRQQLPTVAGAFAGIVADGDERAAVQRHDVERPVGEG